MKKDTSFDRHPSESWGLLNHLDAGNASGDASFRWHDDQR